MEHFVSMPTLPDGLKIPPEFADRLRFEPETGRLVYRGFMSKADFDRLCRISDDWGFRRRLEDLFRLCMPEEPRRPALARLFSTFLA